MISLQKDCEFNIIRQDKGIFDFDCGNQDLNEFFALESFEYQDNLLAETSFST